MTPGVLGGFRRWAYVAAAREISRITRYAGRVIQLDPLPGDTGTLREQLRAPVTDVGTSSALGTLTAQGTAERTIALFNGNFNSSTDIQTLLEQCRAHLGRSDRVVVVLYNSYLAWVYRLADRLGLRHGPKCTTFVTRTDLVQLARLSGFELVRLRPVVHIPWHFFGIGTLVNAVMPAIPGLRWLSLMAVAVLRPVSTESDA